MSKSSRFVRRERQLFDAGAAANFFLDAYGGKERRHLTALWQNWRTVMGAGIADLAFPLGHKDATLLIGADDNMSMQELSLQSVEILERANAFMDSDFFRQVKVALMQGQRDLSRKRPQTPHAPFRVPKPPRLGSLSGKLDPESPVTRCYEAYVAMFAFEEKECLRRPGEGGNPF